MSTLTKVKNWFYQTMPFDNINAHYSITLSPGNGWENKNYMCVSGICTEQQARNISKVPSLVALAEHILAIGNNAYLSCHPEWKEIVNEAKAIKL